MELVDNLTVLRHHWSECGPKLQGLCATSAIKYFSFRWFINSVNHHKPAETGKLWHLEIYVRGETVSILYGEIYIQEPWETWLFCWCEALDRFILLHLDHSITTLLLTETELNARILSFLGCLNASVTPWLDLKHFKIRSVRFLFTTVL